MILGRGLGLAGRPRRRFRHGRLHGQCHGPVADLRQRLRRRRAQRGGTARVPTLRSHVRGYRAEVRGESEGSFGII